VSIDKVDGRLPSTLLGLHLEADGTNLRLYDPRTGSWLPTPNERADREHERADREHERAERERVRAERERQRANELEQELERLRQASKKPRDPKR
jgi:hypothetical protein